VQSLRGRLLSAQYDIAIVGSGYAGSLMAMIARRLGHSVLLLERDRHPRFAIGESSTPLANLLLEQLAHHYQLPRVSSLCKWGSWQQEHADLACGLKRGFSFYHHKLDARATGLPHRSEQMLVAASPHDAIADTHWYRPDFDHYLVREAQAFGVEYRDRVRLDGIDEGDDAVTLRFTQDGHDERLRARFVIDASGPRGFLHRSLSLAEASSPQLPSRRAFFTHFRDVHRLVDVADGFGAKPPFPIDDAAVHHVFDGGWIWVLRFNNGLTSAGAAITDARALELELGEGADAWRILLSRLPAVAAQFSDARTQRDFEHTHKLGFRSAVCSGERWALLPSAAGFVDPLLSSGFALNLLGVTRLAAAIKHDWNTPRFAQSLRRYEQETLAELIATEDLVGALYVTMGDFPLFASIARLYFAAASFSETVHRLQRPQLAEGYLLHDHPEFGPRLRAICKQVQGKLDASARENVMRQVDIAIEPIDVAGLGDHGRRNWYPAEAADLLAAVRKLGVPRDALEQLLRKTGFMP
jgi:tetracycline 7-halogenase / FADH2 O2-dependent halogenase